MATSKTTTKANFYGLLSKVTDPHLRQLLKVLLDQTGNLNDQAAAIGTITQPLATHMDANGNKVQNLKDPTAKQDAATKAYVDKQIETFVSAYALPKP